MRQDILFDTEKQDVIIQPTNNPTLYPFRWCVGESENFTYGEITTPQHIDENNLYLNGIYCEMPYNPTYKTLFIKIGVEIGDKKHYYINKQTGDIWFPAYFKENQIKASELYLINNDFKYHISPNINGKVQINSAYQSDFIIEGADFQNDWCLTQCAAGNNYRYPISGIGFLSYLNSDITSTDLADKIKSEFSHDGTTVLDVEIDQEKNTINYTSSYDDI